MSSVFKSEWGLADTSGIQTVNSATSVTAWMIIHIDMFLNDSQGPAEVFKCKNFIEYVSFYSIR